MINNKGKKVYFSETDQVKKFRQDKSFTSVDVIEGKLVSIIERDNKTGKKILLEDPKVVIGKRKGILAAIGIVSKRKYIGIIDHQGNFIQDTVRIKELVQQFKSKEFCDLDKQKLGMFNDTGQLPRNLKIPLDNNLIINKNGQLVAIEHNGKLTNQYNHNIYQDKLTQLGDVNYLIEDQGRNLNTNIAKNNLKAQPVKGILKNSRTEIEGTKQYTTKMINNFTKSKNTITPNIKTKNPKLSAVRER